MTNNLYYIFILMLFSCKKPEPEIYLIPEHFTGRVVILLGQKSGEEKIYRKTSRVYMIPPSGILKTKFTLNTGESDIDQIKFYFYNDTAEYEIPDFNIKRDTLYKGSQIFYFGNGVLAEKGVNYIDFFVAPYEMRNSFFRKNEKGELIDDRSFWDKVNNVIGE